MTAKEESSKKGRPSDYTPELGDLVCSGIAEGQSLAKICTNELLPTTRTVYTWLRTYPDFLRNYEHAKEDQADKMVEEMLEIADDGTNDYMLSEAEGDGSTAYKLNGENIQRSRLRVDTRKWAASKFKTKKYGDRVLNENKDVSSFEGMDDEELERKRLELERQLKQSQET